MTYHIFQPLISTYAQIRFVEDSDEVTSLFESGNRIDATCFSAFRLAERRWEMLHDCPQMMFGVVAFSERAWIILAPLIAADVQAIKLVNLSPQYFAINVLSILPALDLKKSDVTLFRNGKVDQILKYAFKTDVIQGRHIFRIPERHCDIFVSEKFLDVAIDNGLNGFNKNYPVFQSTEQQNEK